MSKFFRKIICVVLTLALALSGVIAGLGYLESRILLSRKPIAAAAEEIRAKEHFTPISEVPETYVNAVIATEDHRFRQHRGLDSWGIARALAVNIKNKELREGGSTITQQLIKNVYFPAKRDLIKKAAEAFMALEAEKELTKDEIFELYMNVIYFGDGYYCIYDASMGYFGKEPRKMNGYECTLLAGIPNAPSVYAPTKNPRLAEQRREAVVRKMENEGYDVQNTANPDEE